MTSAHANPGHTELCLLNEIRFASDSIQAKNKQTNMEKQIRKHEYSDTLQILHASNDGRSKEVITLNLSTWHKMLFALCYCTKFSSFSQNEKKREEPKTTNRVPNVVSHRTTHFTFLAAKIISPQFKKSLNMPTICCTAHECDSSRICYRCCIIIYGAIFYSFAFPIVVGQCAVAFATWLPLLI